MAEKRIYVDINVFVDLFWNRQGKYRDFAEEASKLFQRTLSCEFRIIVSNVILKELNNLGLEKRFGDFLKQFYEKGKVEMYYSSKKMKSVARKMNISHYSDRLHYLLAKASKADLIITRNWKDFYDFEEIYAFPPELV